METAKEIRQKLKEAGYSSKRVSVTSSRGGYDSSVRIKVKDLTANIERIKEIASGYEKFSRDEITQEILEGGNTFVFVEYDWEVVHAAAELKMEQARQIIEEGKNIDAGTGKCILDAGLYEAVYYPVPHYGLPEICLLKKPDDYLVRTSYCLDNLERYVAHNDHHIAQALVYIEAKLLYLKKAA